VVWSDPYYETGYCLIVPDGSAIKSLTDLNNKKTGIYDEDDAEAFVKENVSSPAAIVRYDDEAHEGEDWLMIHLVDKYAKKFNEDLVDAAIYDYPFAKVVVENSDNDLNIVAFNLNTFSYQIGLPKNNYEFRTELNLALKKVMASPSYKQLVIKYLNFNFDTSLPNEGRGLRIHTVERGETLGSIAVMYYDSSKRWKEIWEANKNRIPDYNLIVVGNKLIIP
jgi:ABC-type amino acid transport substrate-binding protein